MDQDQDHHPKTSLPHPAPRQLITTLINTIGNLPLQDRAIPKTERRRDPKEALLVINPLSRAHPSVRSLLATLHVLFPALLLPALDLLDRQVVARLVVRVDGSDGDGDGGDDDMADNRPPRRATCYLVRSAAPSFGTAARRGRPGGGAAAAAVPPAAARRPPYIVHVDIWSCTCATFAFAAFPPQTAAEASDGNEEEDRDEVVALAWDASDDGEGEEEREGGRGRGGGGLPAWEFGGASRDGLGQTDGGGGGGGGGSVVGGDAVPCCKHLLACVLAERWGPVLGCYVVDRTVTAQELAGIMAEV